MRNDQEAADPAGAAQPRSGGTSSTPGAAGPEPAAPQARTDVVHNMVRIAGRTFVMGSDRHYAEERPAHPVTVAGFWIDPAPVTNAEFRRFVEATGHVTLAERPPDPADYPGADPAMLVPASVVFVKPVRRVSLGNHYSWWSYVPGADWRHPEGPQSSLEGRDQHPVVHVGYDDAAAYARWTGKELPREDEWELAARGGLDGAEFAWGEELAPGGQLMANTWQGEFPIDNRGAGGFTGTSPVGHFPPNGYGLSDMIGNVWEWTCDWYAARHDLPAGGCCSVEPRAVARGREEARRDASCDPHSPLAIPRRVIKGGSFLCAPNYCRRYRPAARMAQPIDTATCHVGFRCVVRE